MKRIICPACWAEFEDLTSACPLCGLPVEKPEDMGETQAQSQPLSAEPADVTGRRHGPSLYIGLAGVIMLFAVVFSLQTRVDDFQRFRSTRGDFPAIFVEAVPGAKKPRDFNGSVTPADFAGTWRIVEGPGGIRDAGFVLKLDRGRLVASNLGGDSFELSVRDGLLRGKFSAEGRDFAMTGVLARDFKEMTLSVELAGGGAARYRAVKD